MYNSGLLTGNSIENMGNDDHRSQKVMEARRGCEVEDGVNAEAGKGTAQHLRRSPLGASSKFARSAGLATPCLLLSLSTWPTKSLWRHKKLSTQD
jgi:hypothetical protein